MTQPLLVVPAAPTSEPALRGRRAVRAGGSAVTILCDVTGAAVAAEMPAAAYRQMSSVLRREIAGRPHILTWCSLHGRVEIPVILMDPAPVLQPVTGRAAGHAEPLLAA